MGFVPLTSLAPLPPQPSLGTLERSGGAVSQPETPQGPPARPQPLPSQKQTLACRGSQGQGQGPDVQPGLALTSFRDQSAASLPAGALLGVAWPAPGARLPACQRELASRTAPGSHPAGSPALPPATDIRGESNPDWSEARGVGVRSLLWIKQRRVLGKK